jgi:hypothetical protein
MAEQEQSGGGVPTAWLGGAQWLLKVRVQTVNRTSEPHWYSSSINCHIIMHGKKL